MATMVPYSPQALHVLRVGNILAPGEEASGMLDRVFATVRDAELAVGSSRDEAARFVDRFATLVYDRRVTVGTPFLTNAGRSPAALSSCVAVPMDLSRPLEDNFPLIEEYYRQNMGSGFNLDALGDPARAVVELNAHARSLSATGTFERYIGNLANIDVDHPRVLEFVRVKTIRTDIVHFNLSVNLTNAFMSALNRGVSFRLRDGRELAASTIWNALVDAAWASGDPGIIFLSRFNADNPTRRLAEYTTTAPCAEVALAPGEACIFGYINVDAFGNSGRVDYAALAQAAAVLTRVLDDAVETSTSAYPGHRSRWIMSAKRKIGIGICGYADLLVRLGISYGSPPSLALLRNVLLTVTLYSKLASVELAAARGPFGAFGVSALKQPTFRLTYGELESEIVDRTDWDMLDRRIKRWGIRNATTTALPPSGRSAILLDASTSIEPWFSLRDSGGKPKKSAVDAVRTLPEGARHAALSAIAATGSVQACDVVSERTRLVLRRAAELATSEHLAVVVEAARCIDDGASKTINLPAAAPRDDVDFAFREAWRLALKAISVYRDSCRAGQPEALVH